MGDKMQKLAKVVVVFLVILILTACNNVAEVELVESVVASSNQNEGRQEESVDESLIKNEKHGEAVSTNQSENIDNTARILKVDTNLKKDHVWHYVPEGVSSMTITVEAENVDTVLFWITETGTETWTERTLIGYDTDGSDGWSITWEFGERIFLDHLTIQAIGSDFVSQATESINLRSRY